MNNEHKQVAAAIRSRVEAATERGHKADGVIVNELCILAWDLAARFRAERPTFPRYEFILACGFKL